MKDKAEKRHIVLLLHGTFANAEEDEGNAWWQKGSETWKELGRRLPEGISLADDLSLFQWSGENTEWAREKAAIELLDKLRAYETQGHHYHLIAHSHGGSVAWGALKEAVRRDIHLGRLKSWSTIGTPFLQYKPATRGLLGLLVVLPVVSALFFFFMISMFPFHEFCESIFGKSQLLSYILTALELIIFSPFFYLVYVVINIRKEAVRTRDEPAIERNAMREYGGCWLGVWSTEDEAINGLRRTVNFRAPIVSQLAFSPDVPFFRGRQAQKDLLTQIGTMLNYFYLPLWNRTIVSWSNKLISSALSKNLQGNNRPGAVACEVMAGPVSVGLNAYPPLPRSVEERLISLANDEAKKVIPRIRSVFGQVALGSEGMSQLMKEVGVEFTGKELVHTSYFNHSEVLDLLCVHLHEMTKKDFHRGALSVSEDLYAWYKDFRQFVRANAINNVPGKT